MSESIYGKDTTSSDLAGYESSEDYTDQGDSRTVKHLMFPFLVESPNPSMPDAGPVLKERTLSQGDTITTEELGPLALERGERLGSFYTDKELKALEAGPAPVEGEVAQLEAGSASDEMGVHELTEYIEQNHPNVDDTIALAKGDPEAAARVLEAEGIATGGDPRSGVTKGLTAIIGEG
jgi:hypothetical protein